MSKDYSTITIEPTSVTISKERLTFVQLGRSGTPYACTLKCDRSIDTRLLREHIIYRRQVLYIMIYDMMIYGEIGERFFFLLRRSTIVYI